MFLYDFRDGKLIVFVPGEIDHCACMRIREKIDALLYEKNPSDLILDLSQTTFMDSAGLGLILGRYRLCSELNIMFTIANPAKQTERILQTAGIDKLIDVCSIDNVKPETEAAD